MSDKLYAERSPYEQGQHYANHVLAMTREGLHDKGGIAAELAHRDIEIERLHNELTATQAVIEKLRTFIEEAPVASGVCCCGDSMYNHAEPMICGHTPVDMRDYESRVLLANTTTDDTALRDRLRQERERCAKVLDDKAAEWDDPAEAYGLRLGAELIRNMEDE